MYSYKHGGKEGLPQYLKVAEDLVVVRTKDNKKLSEAIKSKEGKAILSQLSPVVDFPEAGVTVLQSKAAQHRLVHLRNQAQAQLREEPEVRFAGKVLRDNEQGTPVVYTENFFVKFKDTLSEQTCKELLKKHKLTNLNKCFKGYIGKY